jgi:hypothetical protein
LPAATAAASPGSPALTTRRELPAVRFSAPPAIDGDLADLCWATAPRADRFSDNLYGSPVADQTVAYLGYDEKYLYVGFHASDSQPQKIVAQQTKRGASLAGDDSFTFSIDTFNTHKRDDRSSFSINPLGTQVANLASGRGTKLEWEGAWKSAARITPDGWSGEMAIPWSILNYPSSKRPATCGINFNRFQQRTQINSWWSNVGVNGFYNLDGQWVGCRSRVSCPGCRCCRTPFRRGARALGPPSVLGWTRAIPSRPL